MKKMWYRVSIICMIFVILCVNNSYGFVKNEYKEKYIVTICKSVAGDNRKNILKNELNFNGNLTKEIKVKTSIKITQKKSKWFGGGYSYKIKFRKLSK